MFAFFSSSEIISSPSANKIFSEDFILSENTVSQFITIPCYVQHLFLLNQENNIFCFSAKETHKSFTLYYRQFTGAGFVFYICLLRFLHVIFHERHIISSRKFFLGWDKPAQSINGCCKKLFEITLRSTNIFY